MKTAIRYSFLVLICVAGSLFSRAQITGTINIPNATYPTLDAVVTALNTQGVGSGGATINVTAANAQTAPAGGYKLGTATLNASLNASNPLVINGNGNTLTAQVGVGIAGISVDAIITLRGTDYVTLNNFAIQESALNTPGVQMMERGIFLVNRNAFAPFDGVQNCTIQNCSVTLNKTNTNAPIGILSAHVVADSLVALNITATGDAHSNNKFYGNTVSNAAAGIRIEGYAAAPAPYTLYDQNNDIGGSTAAMGNTVTNIGGNPLFNMFGLLAISQNGLNISNNTVNNAQGGVGNTTQSILIYTLGIDGSATVNNNTLTLTQTAGAAVVAPLYTLSTGNVTVNNNSISMVESGGSGQHFGIWMQSSTTGNVTNNTFTTTHTGAPTGLYWYIYCAGTATATSVHNINNNNFSNIGLLSPNQVMLLYINLAIPTVNVTGNKIVGTFTRTNTVSPTFLLYGTGTAISGTATIAQNNLSNVSVTGSGALYGIYWFPGATQNQVLYSDTLSNWNTNTGAVPVYAMYISSGAINKIYNNVITNQSSAYVSGNFGIYATGGNAVGLDSIYNNTISGISSAGYTYGMYITGGSTLHCFRNKLTDISTSGTFYDAYGLYVLGGTEGLYYNNFITDVKATLSTNSNAAVGAYFTGGVTQRFFHNTVNIDYTSTSTTRGASGVYYTTGVGSFDFRNNIVRVNLTPAGAGTVVALRRNSGTSGVAPVNLASTTNGNVYYTPNVANSFAYAEGTSTALINPYNIANDASFNTPCGLYKSFMSPRESGSFIENNLTQIGTTGTFAPSGTSYTQNGAVPSPIPVLNDYNLVTRGPIADVGALEFTGTSLDGSPPLISYTNLPGTTYCLTAPTLTATITDANGVNTVTNPPRLYYKKSTEANAFSATNTSAFNGWKWVAATGSGPTFTFTPNYSLLSSAIAAGNVIQYFVVAQDNAPTPNVGTNAAGYPAGFCPPSVDLPAAAGPLAANPVLKSYTIQVQPAAPVITPVTSTICPGAFSTLTATSGGAPVLATIGTGTVQNFTYTYPSPYGQYYGSDHEQYLILASELSAQGLSAGNLTSLAFNLATGYTGASMANYTVKLAGTTATSMSAAFINTGFTTVYTNASYNPGSAAGWSTMTFSTPFPWNGTSNVVVDVSFLNCSVCNTTNFCTTSYTSNGVVNQTATPFVSTYYVYADGNCTIPDFAPQTFFSSGTVAQRPNMQLTGSTAQPITWNPVTGLFKNNLLTIPLTATDTNKTVYASPAVTTIYTASNTFTGCNGPASSGATVTLLPATPSAIVPAGAQSICPGNSLTLTAPAGTGYTYQWRINGSVIPGATAQSYTANAVGSYTVSVTSPATGCTGTTATPTVISLYTPPPAIVTPSGATTVCDPATVTLNANTGTGLTYQWKLNGNDIPGATAATYAAPVTGSYTVVVISAVGCITTSAPQAVTVNTVPNTITAGGTTTFCPGGSVVLNGPTGGPFTYQWRQNGMDITGAVFQTYTATTTGVYAVRVTNTSTGCFSTTTPGTTVTVGPPPPAPITPSGTQPLCAGSTLPLTTNTAPGLFYQWKLNGTDIAGANAVTYGATLAGNYTVAVSSGPGCTSITPTPTVIFINPLPTAIATPAGSTTICLGDSVLLSGNAGPGFTYQWQLNGASIPGATSITYFAKQAGPWTVAVTNTNGCTGISAPVNITVNPVPPVSAVASGPTTFCQGGAVTLTGNTAAGITWQWRNTGIDVPGATASSYSAITSGAYTLRTTFSATGCFSTSSPVTVVVNPRPSVATSPSGPVAICQGDTLVLGVGQATGTTTQWNNASGPIAGATGTTYATTLAGVYTAYRVITATGCDATSAPVTVTVNPVPAAIISPSAPAPICPYESVNFIANTGANLTYQWTLNGGPLAGATASTYTANLAGAYRVVVRNSFNCPTTSLPVSLVVKPLPLALVTFSAPLSFCEGSAVILTAAPGVGYSYEWFKNGVPVPNTLFYNSASTTGGYTVKVTNPEGCVATSAPVPVLVYAKPVPVVTYNGLAGTVSTTLAFSSYQWFYNNIAMPGGNTRTIAAIRGGAYRVEVTDTNGCFGGSTQFILTGVSVGGNPAASTGIRVYPNPSNGLVNIESAVRVNAVLRDVSGRTVVQIDDAKGVDLSSYAEGMYMLYLSDESGRLLKAEKITKSSR